MSEESLNFVVAPEQSGKRLDAFLAENIEKRSRSSIQKSIDDGDVLVNGKTSKSSYKLRENDEIEVELTEEIVEGFTPEDIPLDIVYEDEFLAVINKPAGMVVHPGAGVPNGTLANAIAYHFKFQIPDSKLESENISELESGIRNPESGIKNRIGIVHRLDKDTSGLIVIAKSDEIHEKLSEQFRNREVYKSYVALAHGEIYEENGTIDAPIAREKHNRTKMAVRAHGRNAVSLWSVRERFEKFTLLKVEIKTGRTHQIRVHLAHLNHPIVGDELYNAGRDKTVFNLTIRKAIEHLGRFFLHAERLSFTHPQTNEKMNFRVEIPSELSDFLELL
ncbi:MAG: RluA family pseudouridine synthase [Pyrinomonadaceae bacterium]|nr:RluA family pseudouridine synthase [Pyrinomonadaceae bacterium]